MQHEKIGRFVSGGAYEGKQNTSGEQPDVLVSLRKAPSAWNQHKLSALRTTTTDSGSQKVQRESEKLYFHTSVTW